MCNIPAWIYLGLWGLFTALILWSHWKDTRRANRKTRVPRAQNLAIVQAPDGQSILLQFELTDRHGGALPPQEILLSPSQSNALAEWIWKTTST